MKALPSITILDAIRHPALFQPWFRPAKAWEAWITFLLALFGLPMSEDQAATFRRHTGRSTPPTEPVREAWLVVGRRGGKSRIAAGVAVFLACFRDYTDVLGPGEWGTVMLLAADRRQARVLMRYVSGLVDNIPLLANLVVGRTAESVTLSNRIVIEIHTASFRSVRGYTVVAAVCDEIAFWQSEESANPDAEIIAALRPGMATVPGALLLCISSPYARRGSLWDAHRRHYGRDGDPVLVWQAPSKAMNPLLDDAIIAAAYQTDEAAAKAEYGACFRSDIEDFVPREIAEAAVQPGRTEVPPVPWRHRYRAFVDVAGGTGSDSMTLALAHPERDKVVLDLVREAKPPFSPEEVVEALATVLKRYEVRQVVGDKYGGTWPAEVFRRHGVRYVACEQTKSQIYSEALPLLTSRRIEFLDHRRLVDQLLGLERRTSWGGRDSIDHGAGAHDDLVNAALGALVLAWTDRRVGDARLEVRGEFRVEPVESPWRLPKEF